MSKAPYLVFVLLILCLFFPFTHLAEANPDLAALAQARVIQFTGMERLSQPFSFDLELTVPNPALNFSSVVGQPLQLQLAPGKKISGMVENVEQVGVSGREGQYRVRIVPGLNRLAYRRTSRTFGDMNPVQVVSNLLNDSGISGFDTRLNSSFPVKETTIQYQESDLAFFSRLLEGEGIHYHFEPSESGERIVLGDSNNAFPVLPPGKLVFGEHTTPSITAFSRGQAMHAGQVQAGDFNWRTPQVNLIATAQTPIFSDLVEGLFPARVDSPQEAQRYATLRLGARMTEGQSCRGESTYTQMQPGYRFLLAGHPRNDFNQEYVVTGVNHEGTAKSYRNTFTCIPANVAFRPTPITPQPTIPGVLPAIVVGPQGETKHVDQFGRVRIRFPWRNPAFSNHDGLGDSGWVRVAQIAAGTGTDSMWIPDIGDEVLVAFEHGDSRRPVVIGSLYNGNDPPPSPLPENKFRSMLQSRSATGVINAIVMDESNGQERLILRSGNHFLSLSPTGITASSEIQTPSPVRQKFRPPASSPRKLPQPPKGLKTPTMPVIPQR